jgi:hypothetical protein
MNRNRWLLNICFVIESIDVYFFVRGNYRAAAKNPRKGNNNGKLKSVTVSGSPPKEVTVIFFLPSTEGGHLHSALILPN